MTRYSVEPRTRKYIKRYRILTFARDFSAKYRKKLLGTTTKNARSSKKLLKNL